MSVGLHRAPLCPSVAERLLLERRIDNLVLNADDVRRQHGRVVQAPSGGQVDHLT